MALPFSCARAPAPTTAGPGRIPWIEVSVSETPEEMAVRVAGQASIGLADELASTLLWVSVRRPPLVTLDLSGLSHLSCLAMGALVTFRRGVVRAGGRVRLAAALQGSVRESLERAGLLALFGPPEGSEEASADPRKAQVLS
jgi:anti-anti-sigma regulatory factor